jgi:hypothetical protein
MDVIQRLNLITIFGALQVYHLPTPGQTRELTNYKRNPLSRAVVKGQKRGAALFAAPRPRSLGSTMATV